MEGDVTLTNRRMLLAKSSSTLSLPSSLNCLSSFPQLSLSLDIPSLIIPTRCLRARHFQSAESAYRTEARCYDPGCTIWRTSLCVLNWTGYEVQALQGANSPGEYLYSSILFLNYAHHSPPVCHEVDSLVIAGGPTPGAVLQCRFQLRFLLISYSSFGISDMSHDCMTPQSDTFNFSLSSSSIPTKLNI
jgi:hypothetical protein